MFRSSDYLKKSQDYIWVYKTLLQNELLFFCITKFIWMDLVRFANDIKNEMI